MVATIEDRLSQFLQLNQVDSDHFRSDRNNTNLGGEVFGGQYLGQSVWAALQTAPLFVPQSLHGFFLRAARADKPLDVSVERTREGRRFAHRRITFEQEGREVFRAEVALCILEGGQPEHQRPMPQVPRPADLRNIHDDVRDRQEWLGPVATARAVKDASSTTFRAFLVTPEIGMGKTAVEPRFQYWLLPYLTEVAGAGLRYAALAYLSDAFANMASRVRYASNAYDRSLGSLSLSHAIWFHGEPVMPGGVFCDIESPYASGGIGNNRGLIYGCDGTLFASVSQDAMIRYES